MASGCHSCWSGLRSLARGTASTSRHTTFEQSVAREWERVLGLPEGTVQSGDSFYALGGESLLALRACAAIQYMVTDTPMPTADEQQFGMLSGPFTVLALLAADSLADYCVHLKTHGFGRVVREDDAVSSSQKQRREQDRWEAADGAEVTWAEVRDAARSTKEDAAVHLEQLLARAPPDLALRWCAAAPRSVAGVPRFTALHAAAQAGAESCLRLLLSRRAKPTVTEGGSAMTPSHYAAMSSTACLRLLIDAKAPMTVRDARGQSLVHAAARAGNAASLELLLSTIQSCQRSDRGQPRALRTGEGNRGLLEWSDRWARTAVHWAVLNGHDDALNVLLRSGALPEPRLITEHQMSKRTHMTQETPLALAVRVHGESSTTANILRAAIAAGSCSGEAKDAREPTAKSPCIAEDKPAKYVVTIAEPRLEKLALWELKERLGGTVQRLQCRMFFTCSASPDMFLGLKAAEKICAVALHASASDLAPLADMCGNGVPELDKASAAWVLSASAWDDAVALWRRFNGATAAEAGEAEELTFKVTCRRKGSRFASISSQGLAVALASALTSKFGWKARVRRPDLEVRVLLGDADLLVDLPLLYQGAVRLGGGELVEAGLSAQVAWAMARSAELVPGDCVLDPMCGKGVVLVESALSWPGCRYLGLDVDPEQLRGAARNVEVARVGGAVLGLLRGDARRLPLPSRCIDALICDVPFGKQYSTVEECRGGLYDAVLREFDRVVVERGGRMVILTSLEQEPWLLRAAGFDVDLGDSEADDADRRPPGPATWDCIARRKTPLGFLEGVILVFRRRTASSTAAVSPALAELSDRLWWETSGGRGDWASLKVSQRPPMQRARGREI
eukprot:TRINITY_DN17205_c0_g1_i1.p1 TRINITY_DN17205_c0_g1~~TRINITY_DN17205_c0_g1_i1.p1  ORF type:complete len:861 (+),score=153.89 TRINITY_DN17205_c0_g1_i1:28-2583(+)